MYNNLRRGDIVAVYGEPASGKTEVLLNFVRTRPNDVNAVFIDADMTIGPDRWDGSDKGARVLMPELHHTLENVARLIRNLAMEGVDLIVCDDVARMPTAHPESEDDPLGLGAEVLSSLVENLKEIDNGCGPTVIFGVGARQILGGGPSLASGLTATTHVVFGDRIPLDMTVHVQRNGGVLGDGSFHVEIYRKIILPPFSVFRG